MAAKNAAVNLKNWFLVMKLQPALIAAQHKLTSSCRVAPGARATQKCLMAKRHLLLQAVGVQDVQGATAPVAAARHSSIFQNNFRNFKVRFQLWQTRKGRHI